MEPFVYTNIGLTLLNVSKQGSIVHMMKSLDLMDPDIRGDVMRILFIEKYSTSEELARLIMAKFERPEADAAQIMEATRIFWEDQVNNAFPVPGALEFTNRLVQEGIEWGVVSNIWVPFYQALQKHFGEVEKAVLSFEHGKMKPSKELLTHAATLAENRSITMIGCQYTKDIMLAIDVGWKTIWIKNDSDQDLHLYLDPPEPTHTVESINDIDLAWLQ
ncbi:HAD family hydrolase [Magnetococcales bacterium HHB-1]